MNEDSFIIGDAGGTSTQWRLSKGGKISQFKTIGFNAYTHSVEDLIKDIRDVFGGALEGINTVHFYAAGADIPEQKRGVSQRLSSVFHGIPTVENDLVGVSRALCGTSPGNVCILGTGANACQYDGEQVDKVSASLGYVLGDEGSGAYMGKKLLTKVFRGQLDIKVIEAFQQTFDLTSHHVLDTIYNKPKPNHFLASFANFISDHRNDPEVYQLIYRAFMDFFDAFFPGDIEGEVFHFSGSIAYYFSDILRQVGADRGIQIKNIVESPIAGLLLYHQNYG